MNSSSRTRVGDIDYFVLNFTLAVGERLTDQIINGRFFRSDVTFTVSLSLRCWTDFHGPDCSMYCYPANSSEMGHHTCLSELQGYQNETTNCTTPREPAVSCHKSAKYYSRVCKHSPFRPRVRILHCCRRV